MRAKLTLLLIVFIFSGISLHAQKPKMKKIFNGKTLDGWAAPENNIWWTAGKGVLSVKNGPEKKGSILWTEKEYQDFIIQLDFRMGDGTVDSGVFLRSESTQIQIGESGSLKRDMTASPYIPGKGYPVEAEGVQELLKPKGWNKMKISTIDKVSTVWLNGKKVMTYQAEKMAAKGPIGLQLHGNREMAIEFRKIKAAEL